MVELRLGNLVDGLLNKQVDYIFHCCNCQNNFGSGVAKEIKERIPRAFEADYQFYVAEDNMLGNFSTDGEVYNLYGQLYFGRWGEHFKATGRQLNYGAYSIALLSALEHIKETTTGKKILGFPFKIGSDRAGGDWNVVREITEFLVNSYGHNLIWYKLEE